MRHIHPGELLREEIIPANKLTVAETAKLLDISPQNLNDIINEKSDVTPEIAIKITKVFGGSAETWIKLQSKFNQYLAIEKRREQIANNALKSLEDYHSGKLKPLTAKQAIEILNKL